ncbi:hypothetical protein [Pseudomonas serbica]|uniref:hypothetical protein n=1 Tax=Pseudomonas serbica TaxID=2965074 RepID=UPI00237C1C74|nr:hypothetical protein [Pseudomonas serbica]
MGDLEPQNSKVTPAGASNAGCRWCPVMLSNLWQNTKPKMPTAIRVMFLLFQVLLVVVAWFAGMDIYRLEDPWSAPLLNFACVAFGISELMSLLFALRKPPADV